MIFTETELKGAYIIEIEQLTDHRGFFGRAWCRKEFEQHNLAVDIKQANVSSNIKKGTLRGMHYQVSPYQETKLVRCTRGAIFDVIIDLRTDSETYGRHIGVELTAKNYRMLYVPEDFAHGFITLENDSEVTYQVSEFYTPGSEKGLRWDDPLFKIAWPGDIQVISDKDSSWPDFSL